MDLALTGLTALLAGTSHVVAGPDHLAAIMPLAAGQPRRAASLGALWGLGHGFGVACCALAGYWLKDSFALEQLSRGAELAVGPLLVVLGLWTFRKARARSAASTPGGAEHTAPPPARVPTSGPAPAPLQPPAHTHSWQATHAPSAFGFGLLHGGAGAGHLLGVLPTLALEGPALVLYVCTYGFAAVITMAACALGIGALARNPRRMPVLVRLAGAFSVLVGLYWAGLTFTSAP